jgi:WD40 repeat protein
MGHRHRSPTAVSQPRCGLVLAARVFRRWRSVYLCGPSKIEVRDATTGELRLDFPGKSTSLDLLISRDGRTLLQRTENSSIVVYRQFDGVWNTEDLFASNSDMFAIDFPGNDVSDKFMTATPDGNRLAVVDKGALRVFDTATRRTVAVIAAAEEPATWLALSPDGRSLATGRPEGGILIYDLDKAAPPIANP